MDEAGLTLDFGEEQPAAGNLPPLPAPVLGPEGLPAGISFPPAGVNTGRGGQ